MHHEGEDGALHPERDRHHHREEGVHFPVVLGQGRRLPHAQDLPRAQLGAVRLPCGRLPAAGKVALVHEQPVSFSVVLVLFDERGGVFLLVRSPRCCRMLHE